MIADGILPSNEGRGYVLRRLLRRAVMKGHLLGLDKPFLNEYVDEIVNLMGDVYPEIVENRELARRVILSEEERFGATLRQGRAFLDEALAGLEGEVLPGDRAFTLHDTYGFPVEVTRELCGERGIEVDMEGFGRCMDEQRERARAANTKDAEAGLVHVRRRDERDLGGRGAHRVPRLHEERGGCARAGDREGRPAGRRAGSGRGGPRGAGRHAVLRREGRPDRRYGRSGRRRRCRGGARYQGAREGLDRAYRQGDGRAGRRAHPSGRHRSCRHRRAPPRAHTPQPHGHAYPALGAAPGAGRSREAGRQLRCRQSPALRLHAFRGHDGRADRRGGAPGEREGHGEPSRARLRDLARVGPRGRRDGALRREVRRVRARAGHRRVLAESSAAARTCRPRARSVS